MKPSARLGAMILAALAVGCSSLEITAPPLQQIEEITFHPSLEVDLSSMTRLESGVWVEDLVEGEGEAAAAQTTSVNVRYQGWVATSGQTFIVDEASIILGVGEIPAGLDLAIQGMQGGGVRRAVVPPELGYGRIPTNFVPGGSVLVYEIELLEVFPRT